MFSSPFAVARRARAYASLRKEVSRDGSVRWVRLAGVGEGDRGDADGTTADDRRERRSRPYSRPNRTRTPTDPETNRQRALNTRVSTAPDAVSALREFAEAHQSFPNGVNDVNVAALFVVLARSNRLCSSRGAKIDRDGGDDDRESESDEESENVAFARTVVADLLVRLNTLAPNTTGRVCANVLHALGQLEARDWWINVKRHRGGVRDEEGEDVTMNTFAEVFEDAVKSVARRAALTASAMNAQELANAYNGISRLDAFVAASVPHTGWVSLSEALVTQSLMQKQKREKSNFAALAAVLALNALASDKLSFAASATSQSAFDALISVAACAKQWDDSEARAVEKLSEQGLANVLNACAKLEKARLAVERLETLATRDEDEREGDEALREQKTKTKTKENGWRLFTSRVASLAPRFGDQGLSVALHALTLCGDDARASVDDRGWRAFAEATERLAPTASPQAAAMLLNAAWKLRAEPSARGFHFAPSALDALGRRTAEILLEDDENRGNAQKRTFLLDEQATFVAADALGKLPAARAGFAAVAAEAKKTTAKRRATKDAWFLLAERLANRVIEDGTSSSSDSDRKQTERVPTSGGGPAASFHVLARVPELASALITKRVWRDVGVALCLSAPSLDAEDCARVLNGYAKLRRNALVTESTPARTLKAYARRVAALAASEDVEAMHVATLADALKKLSVARGEFDALAKRSKTKRNTIEHARNPWDDLASIIGMSALALEPLQVTNVVSALGWLEPLASALARVDGGWRRVLASARRRADSIKRGANESIAASAFDFSEPPEARKWLEKTSAGFELVRGHGGYLTYGDERDRERLVALETEFRDELARIA